MRAAPQPIPEEFAQGVACHLSSRGPAATQRLGQIIGETLQAGDVLLLDGPLGAGKTCLVQGLAVGLGVPPGTIVNSPSFPLVHQYEGRLWLVHADLYRLEHPEELSELGLWEAAETGGVVVIEWASRFPGEMPRDHLALQIVPGNGRMRELTLRASGPTAKARLCALERKLPAERRIK